MIFSVFFITHRHAGTYARLWQWLSFPTKRFHTTVLGVNDNGNPRCYFSINEQSVLPIRRSSYPYLHICYVAQIEATTAHGKNWIVCKRERTDCRGWRHDKAINYLQTSSILWKHICYFISTTTVIFLCDIKKIQEIDSVSYLIVDNGMICRMIWKSLCLIKI